MAIKTKFTQLLVPPIKQSISKFDKPAKGIVLITIMTRLALLPLTLLAVKSSKKRRQLQPEVKQIKQNYEAEHGKRLSIELKRKKNLEIQAIYKQAKINPFQETWPVVVQIPLYELVSSAVKDVAQEEQAKKGGWLWFKDLSRPDRYYILPILIIIAEYAAQRMGTHNEEYENIWQGKLNEATPLVTSVFSGFRMTRQPAGQSLYVLVAALFNVVQQYFINGWGSLFKIPFRSKSS